METINELWLFLRTRKKYWLWPFIFIVLLLSAVLFLAQGSALAPFIYSLF